MKKTTKKAPQPDLNEILAEMARLAMVLVGAGLDAIEEIAKRKELFHKYTYLNTAIKNVKNAIPFIAGFLAEKTRGVEKNVGHKRTKGHKKI